MANSSLLMVAAELPVDYIVRSLLSLAPVLPWQPFYRKPVVRAGTQVTVVILIILFLPIFASEIFARLLRPGRGLKSGPKGVARA